VKLLRDEIAPQLSRLALEPAQELPDFANLDLYLLQQLADDSQELLHIPDEHAFALNWTLVNSGLSKLVLGRQGMHLLSINEHSHLEGEHAHLLSYR